MAVSASVAARHGGGGGGLVDEYQRIRIEVELALKPRLARRSHVRPVLLGRVAAAFFRVMPWRLKKRDRLLWATRMPRPGQCAAPVRRYRAAPHRGIGSGRREPRSGGSADPRPDAWVRRDRHGRTVRTSGLLAKLTPKRSAAWCRDAPAWTARTTRWRRSTDRAEDIGALLRRPTPQPATRFTPFGSRPRASNNTGFGALGG